MRKVLSFTILALTMLGGVALADRHGGRDGRSNHSGHSDRGRWDRGGSRSGGVVVRDHRWGGRVAAPGWHAPRQHSYRRPVFINNGYYQFHNGYRYAYSRPIIRHRYFDVRVRPQYISENYQPVSGYVWIAGQWQWNGYEWQWQSGHYDVDPNYVDADGDGYVDGAEYPPQY